MNRKERQERQEEDKLFERMLAFDALSENNYFLLADVFKRQIETLGKTNPYLMKKVKKDGWTHNHGFYSPINTIIVSINDLCDTIRMVDMFFDKENFIDVCFKKASENVLNAKKRIERASNE